MCTASERPVVLSSERLTFHPITPEDRDFVAAMLADPDVMALYPRSVGEAGPDEWIACQLERYANDGFGLWLVCERETGQPVGQVGLVIQSVNGATELEIAYLLHRPFWGRGYATEAAIACRDFVFTEFDRPYVLSLILPENERSVAVARRLGMVPVDVAFHAGYLHEVHVVWRPGEQDP